MRLLRRLCLLFILAMVSTSQAQGDYPACWETELTTSLVSVPFYRSYYSQLEEVETADDLVEFAESHLPSRERAWGINERCAESVELIWRTQQELSLRAAYKAVVFGLLAKVDAEPAALAAYNPVRGILAEPWYPEQFTALVDRHEALIDSGERLYALAPGEDALPACSEAQLASLAALRPDYRRIIDDAQAVASIDELLTLAARQIVWREQWAFQLVDPQADGSIHYPLQDGLKRLPPCSEAAELLWLMNRAATDATTGAALSYAGAATDAHPYLTTPSIAMTTRRGRCLNAASASGLSRRQSAGGGRAISIRAKPSGADCRKTRRLSMSTVQIKSVDDYLAFAEREVAWRQQLWAELPNCAEAIVVALELSRAAGDVSAAFALTFAGVDIESNPYIGKQEHDFNLVGRLDSHTLGRSRFRDSPQRLRSCGGSDLERLGLIVAQYHLYREAMADFAHALEFLTISESLYHWRDGLYAALPACAKAFEIGALMGHIADDYIALFGLVHAGYGRDSNPYYTSVQANSFELVDWIEAVEIKSGTHEVVWNYGGQIQSCHSDEVGALAGILDAYLAALDLGTSISSLEDLSAFGDAQIAWRRDSWPELPNCAEAFEIGLHIYRTAGDRIHFDVPAIAEDRLADVFAGDTALHSRLGEIFRGVADQMATAAFGPVGAPPTALFAGADGSHH